MLVGLSLVTRYLTLTASADTSGAYDRARLQHGKGNTVVRVTSSCYGIRVSGSCDRQSRRSRSTLTLLDASFTRFLTALLVCKRCKRNGKRNVEDGRMLLSKERLSVKASKLYQDTGTRTIGAVEARHSLTSAFSPSIFGSGWALSSRTSSTGSQSGSNWSTDASVAP